MKSLRKIAVALTSLFALVGCSFSMTLSSAGFKEKLEAAEYTVTYMSSDEYEESEMGQTISTTGGLDDFISAYKSNGENNPGEYLYVWFFMSLDNAETFYDFYSSELSDIKVDDGAKLTTGQKQNTVWCGTSAAAKVVDLNKIF